MLKIVKRPRLVLGCDHGCDNDSVACSQVFLFWFTARLQQGSPNEISCDDNTRLMGKIAFNHYILLFIYYFLWKSELLGSILSFILLSSLSWLVTWFTDCILFFYNQTTNPFHYQIMIIHKNTQISMQIQTNNETSKFIARKQPHQQQQQQRAEKKYSLRWDILILLLKYYVIYFVESHTGIGFSCIMWIFIC